MTECDPDYRLRPMPARSLLLIAALALVVVGCAKLPTLGLYKLDIQQGNVITEQMLSHLEPGMEKRKVRFLLGTPLVTDVFDPDRWDYLYTFQSRGGKRLQRHIVAIFENDRLVRLEGDVLASEFAVVPEATPERVVTVPDQPPDSLLGRFLDDEERQPLDKKPSDDDDVDSGLFDGWFGGGSGNASERAASRDGDSAAPNDVTPPAPASESEDELVEDSGEQQPAPADGSTDQDEVGFFERLSNEFGLRPPLPADERN